MNDRGLSSRVAFIKCSKSTFVGDCYWITRVQLQKLYKCYRSSVLRCVTRRETKNLSLGQVTIWVNLILRNRHKHSVFTIMTFKIFNLQLERFLRIITQPCGLLNEPNISYHIQHSGAVFTC